MLDVRHNDIAFEAFFMFCACLCDIDTEAFWTFGTMTLLLKQSGVLNNDIATDKFWLFGKMTLLLKHAGCLV